jgi:putative Flp pilus-assembly TadE/G-like protein
MKNNNRTQRGQALILIALAIVGLVGFTALAIDGSNIFSDHRHSQNASDTAAYAGALSYVRDPGGNWQQAAQDRAADNGYSSNDGVTEVDVYLCSDLPQAVSGRTLACKGLPPGANPADYVYVHIKSRVKLYFAPVIGWREIFNHTDAVVLAETATETSFFPGYALVSTMLGCPNYNHDPFKVEGSSVTTIINAGILVNSDCQDPDPAYDQRSGASSVETDTGVCVVGDYSYAHTVPPPTNCEPIDVSKYTLPNPTCSHEGRIVEKSHGVYTAYPGLYGRNFNFDSIDDINPNGKLMLQKGIYCFYDGLELNSQWEITTDLDGQGDYDSATEGVFFYVPQGDITFNGGSDIHIHAVGTTEDNFPADYVNYLIYVPPTNPNDIIITGGSGSQFTGTILAPNSYIRLNGGSGTVGLNAQVIGYAVALEGSGTLDIHYQADENATTTLNPSLAGIE